MKRLINEVSVLITKKKRLVEELPDLLSPKLVCNLTDTKIQRIVSESYRLANKRTRATEKLWVLESGMAELKQLKTHNPSVLEN